MPCVRTSGRSKEKVRLLLQVSPGRSLGPCAELLPITCFILQMFEATAISMPVFKINMRMKYTRITDDSFFYPMNLVYFILIFIFNTGILMAVASNICKMKQVIRSSSAHGPRERPGETCRSSLTVMGYVNDTSLYLFCILNSTQAKKQSKRDMEERLTSTPLKSSGVKCLMKVSLADSRVPTGGHVLPVWSPDDRQATEELTKPRGTRGSTEAGRLPACCMSPSGHVEEPPAPKTLTGNIDYFYRYLGFTTLLFSQPPAGRWIKSKNIM
ncbi:hypothetical protein EYF80_039697 [Liparis tanakae]|uniref:Uncharacterized protein n=1 Tax=Liparis tanakae TaxID=230148 RepID=A0A4Z2GA42_9TELE|nr:hypothetical protein EYF80_039697 [Liparis tanakae]